MLKVCEDGKCVRMFNNGSLFITMDNVTLSKKNEDLTEVKEFYVKIVIDTELFDIIRLKDVPTKLIRNDTRIGCTIEFLLTSRFNREETVLGTVKFDLQDKITEEKNCYDACVNFDANQDQICFTVSWTENSKNLV